MLVKGLDWGPAEALLKGAFLSNRIRGLHCLKHDGMMLPRENHESQNSVGGDGTLSQDVIGWRNLRLPYWLLRKAWLLGFAVWQGSCGGENLEITSCTQLPRRILSAFAFMGCLQSCAAEVWTGAVQSSWCSWQRPRSNFLALLPKGDGSLL